MFKILCTPLTVSADFKLSIYIIYQQVDTNRNSTVKLFTEDFLYSRTFKGNIFVELVVFIWMNVLLLFIRSIIFTFRWCNWLSFLCVFGYLFFFRACTYVGLPHPSPYCDNVQLFITLRVSISL